MGGSHGFPILVFVLTSCSGNGPSAYGIFGAAGAGPDAVGTICTAGGGGGVLRCVTTSATVTGCCARCVPNAFLGEVQGGVGCSCQASTPDPCPTVGCVDKTTDPDNCGTCGTKCPATSTCNGGTCGPAPTVLLQPVASCVSGLMIAVNAGTVYYADASHNTINELGAAAPLAVTEMGATSLALQGSDLYWYSKGTNTIRKLAGASGTPTDVFTPRSTTAAPTSDPTKVDTVGGFLVTSDGMSVYVSVGTNVVKVSATTAGGGTPVIIAEEKSGGIPGALALNGTTSIVYPTGIIGKVRAAVLSATPASCGVEDANGNVIMDTCTVLAQSQSELLPHFVAVIAGTAYWIDGLAVNSEPIPAAGGMGTTFETISIGQTFSTAAVAMTDAIYFADADPSDPTHGYIEKTALAPNSTAMLLARGQTSPTSVAADATKVYWANADCSIMSQNR